MSKTVAHAERRDEHEGSPAHTTTGDMSEELSTSSSYEDDHPKMVPKSVKSKKIRPTEGASDYEDFYDRGSRRRRRRSGRRGRRRRTRSRSRRHH